MGFLRGPKGTLARNGHDITKPNRQRGLFPSNKKKKTEKPLPPVSASAAPSPSVPTSRRVPHSLPRHCFSPSAGRRLSFRCNACSDHGGPPRPTLLCRQHSGCSAECRPRPIQGWLCCVLQMQGRPWSLHRANRSTWKRDAFRKIKSH